MNKIVLSILCSIIIFMFVSSVMVYKKPTQESIASKIIRFHVIANSDSNNDQALKLRIRDEVLGYMSPKLKKISNIEECRKILLDNSDEIIKLARKIIKQSGYNYSVKVALSNENFPIKTYGNITLPPGRYEAYRIIIGEGQGHNWWCVMFPPLCFVDITKSEVSYKETEKLMKSVLTDDEYNLINNMKDEKIKKMIKDEVIKKAIEKKAIDKRTFDKDYVKLDDKPVKVKFKIVEIMDKIIKRLHP